jgi:hypothetical protein
MTASSPGSVRPRTAAATASETPHVTVISVSGSAAMPLTRAVFWAMARRNAGNPQVKPY